MNNAGVMKIKYSYVTPDIITHYNLQDKVTTHGYIYIRVKKGIYGLEKAAILAYDNLQKNLKPFGYFPGVGTVGIWKHITRHVTFRLCVDDFGIKYTTKEHAHHLLNSIGTNYKYTCDWSGSNYCGLTLDWHYEHGYVDISMPGYVGKH